MMMAAPGVTRTPSGRIRRIPSDLMKRVRCAYPGCDLAVIPSNFARHWKFKHTDMPQPPIESLTVVRGDNTSDTGDVIWPHILKPPPPEPIKTQPTPHLRVDGKERKRARQRNYICPECHRPLIGSNFGRHWASKHPHITQPSLINLEMEALSGGEEDLAPPDPLSITSSPKPTVKKRKVVCRECEMPMINSNFSRHWASRHPHLDMPLLSELEVIDVEVDASPPLKKPHRGPVIHQSHMPITIPYPSDDLDGDHLVQNIEPADEEFEDLEEIEDEDEDVINSRNNLEYDLIDNDYDEEDLEEVTVEPVHYNNGLSGGDKGGPQFGGGFGGKRHKKVYCPECNMPMLCNNFRRHFHRRHGDIAHRMPSIHSLKLVPDEEYEMAQINKVVPPYNNPPHHHKNKELSSFPEVQQHISSTPILNNNNATNSPVRVKRKIVCSECGMAMIGSNFGRHWASKHSHLPQPALQDLVYADSAESGEAETVVCEPLFFGTEDLSEDENDNIHEDGGPAMEHLLLQSFQCGYERCSFSSSDKISLYHHRSKCGHFKNNGIQSSKAPHTKVKKVWKKKVVCPECDLQTITSNFSRHWMAKHGHLPTPGLRDLQVITIDDPGFQGNVSSVEAEEIVVDPTIAGMNHIYEDDGEIQDDYEEFDYPEDQIIDCVQEEDDGEEVIHDYHGGSVGVIEDEDEDNIHNSSNNNSSHNSSREDFEAEGGVVIDEDDIEEVDQDDDDHHHPNDNDDEDNTPIKYSNNKINCNFDINSLLEDDDDDGDDQDESGEFASVEVN